jgi:hypothetical protein
VPTCTIEVDYNISARELLLRVINFKGSGNPICLCGISLASGSLKVLPEGSGFESGAIVKIEVPRHHGIQPRNLKPMIGYECFRCSLSWGMQTEFQQKDGSYICLYRLCENLRGYLFTKETDPCDASNMNSLRQNMLNSGVFTLPVGCLRVHKISGVEVTASSTVNKVPDHRRFSLDALVHMAVLEKEKHPDESVRLCSMIKGDIGPRASLQMRRCG